MENLGVETSERYIPDAVSIEATTSTPIELVVVPSEAANEISELDDTAKHTPQTIKTVPELLQNETSVGAVTDAEQLLGNFFKPITEPTKYIASYRAPNGLELAFMRTTKTITVWTESIDGYDSIGMEPEKRYSPNEPRNSNLNRKNTPRLRLGFAAMVWKLSNVDELMDLINWYSSADSVVTV